MSSKVETSLTISVAEVQSETFRDSSTPLGMTTRLNESVSSPVHYISNSPADPIRHIYVHIPFCARICPYCAFYKELLDRSQTHRFCEALLGELRQQAQDRHLLPSTIYFGGGTPTALTTPQLEFLLGGFRDQLDLSELIEWTTEANPGSVSASKAALLQRLGINRISLGIQSWDDDLLKLLGREHRAQHLRES